MLKILNSSYSNDFQEKRILDIYLPDDTHKKGVIIFIPGGNWQNGDKDQWQEVAEYFCQSGFLAATVNYRLAPQWNLPAQIEDIRLAIAFVKKKAAELGHQPQKLILCGTGAGAYLSLLMGVIQPHEYLGKSYELLDEKTYPKAIIAFFPIVSIIKGFHSPKIDERVETLLDFDPNKEQECFLKDCSPKERPEDFNCPILIFHNEKNKEIPMKSIIDFQKELISCQVPVKLFTGIENIGSLDIAAPVSANWDIMRIIENFLQEYLL